MINVKTMYTFLSSVIEIDDLINYAKSNNLDSLFICDKNMYGVMEFITKCQNNNIKPIVGVDFDNYLLYAKNYNGYQNLMKLTTLKSTKNLEKNDFINYVSDLICIIKNDELEIKNLFNDVYYDINNKNNVDNKKVIDAREILCFDKKKMEVLNHLLLLRDNKTVSDDYDFLDYVIPNNYNEIEKEIISKCNLVLPKFSLNLPKYTLYNDTKGLNDYEYLCQLSMSGLSKRLNNSINEVYKKRLLYELDIINKMGFANYFLIVYDFIKYAKMNNILVGPGRGSACGSLVSFSLGITDVDPIKYNLLFERFLNIERITMPDIDIDFPDEKRDLVIDYVVNKYGLKKVSAITTFGTFGVKMAIRDMGRVLNVPLYTIDEICKLVGNNENLKEIYLKNNKLQSMVESDNKLKKLFFLASNIEGMVRHTSIHAAGIIMCNEELDNYVPLVYDDNMYLSGYEACYLEDLGLLKMDFLGLKNLTIISQTIDLINEKSNKKIKFNEIPLDDLKTFKLFQDGNTLGVFQFESSGMRSFLKDLHPESFIDIASANALYRPGPSDNIPLYINRKNKGEKINYYHDSLKDILKDTYGIIVYQEQIMQIASKMAGYTLGEADILRRAMSKKKIDILEKEEERFINGAIKKGYSKETAKEVYDLILHFASYGFNKSHSVAYSIIAYKMAYLKANEPLYFYLSILNNGIMDSSKTKEYFKEVKRLGIKLLKPDINKSGSEYKLYYNNIILPFTKIKGISKIISEKIILSRGDGFNDIYDFISKMISNGINRNIIENLIDSDSLNCFNYNHQTLYDNLDSLINYGNLCKDINQDFVLKPEIEIKEEFSKDILINREKDLFGIYLTNHPVVEYKLKNTDYINLCDIEKYFNKVVKTIVMIDSIKEIKTKKGETMQFINASDEEESMEYVLFPKTYLLYNDLKKGDIIKIEGRVERRSNYQIIISKIWRLS